MKGREGKGEERKGRGGRESRSPNFEKLPTPLDIVVKIVFAIVFALFSVKHRHKLHESSVIAGCIKRQC